MYINKKYVNNKYVGCQHLTSLIREFISNVD